MRSLLYDNIAKRLRIAADPSLRQRDLRRLERNNRSERDALGESAEGTVTRRSTDWLSEM